MPDRLSILVVVACLAAACASADDEGGVATPSITLPARAAIESPVDVNYSFVVAADAPALSRDYRVFVHFNDPTGEQLWTDDHLPVTPTSQWKPNMRIAYTRTMFVPKVPFTGETTIDLGLYLPGSDERVPLSGMTVGHRAYRVGTLEVQPPTGGAVVRFTRGWHQPEIVPASPGVEWRWSTGESVLQFRNPHRDATVLLDLDQPERQLGALQQVEVRAGTTVLGTFTVEPGERAVRRIPIPRGALGEPDNTELTLTVAPTFTPAYLPGATSRDVRTLGVRVFHGYISPAEQPK